MQNTDYQTLVELEAIKNVLQKIESHLNISPGQDPHELLTMKALNIETGWGMRKLAQIFDSGELKVHRESKPFTVTRKEWNRYLDEHDGEIVKK